MFIVQATGVFVLGKLFQPSLMLVSKAGVYSDYPCRSKGGLLLPYPQHFIFFATYVSAHNLDCTRPGRLASDKHSSLWAYS
jgi:hypothetical protein